MTTAEIQARYPGKKLAPNQVLAAWLILTTGNTQAAKLKALDKDLLASLRLDSPTAKKLVDRFNKGHGDAVALMFHAFATTDEVYTGPDCPVPEQVQNIVDLP